MNEIDFINNAPLNDGIFIVTESSINFDTNRQKTETLDKPTKENYIFRIESRMFWCFRHFCTPLLGNRIKAGESVR